MERDNFRPFSFCTRGRLVEYNRPVVMGILNITEDSFYDGGRYRTPEAMLARAHTLLEEGADIIDVGASSSRPGATLLDPTEEAARLQEAVSLLRRELPEVVISVDTCYSLPARTAIEAGADVINDIGGGMIDPTMFETVASLGVPYILMHGAECLLGSHTGVHQPTAVEVEGDVVDAVVRFFSSSLDRLYGLGVKDVWLDPGFGFAKSMEQNLQLLERLGELTSLFREPVLVGISRKRMIYTTLGTTAEEALFGTIALDALALDRGAAIVRVHDARPAADTVRLLYRSKR